MQDEFFKDTQLFSFELNRRLRDYRRRKGLALSFVARALEISEEELINYEGGRKIVPSEILYQLSLLYDVSVTYFLRGFEIPSQKSPSPLKECSFY